MKVIDVAKKLGKSPEFVRIGLRTGRLPFGSAVQVSPNKWSYHVSDKLFKEYMGE